MSENIWSLLDGRTILVEFSTPQAATNWGWFGNRSSGEGLEFSTSYPAAWTDSAWLRGGLYIMPAETGAGGLTASISYTQDSQTTSATVTASDSLAISYTQANQTTSANITASDAVSIGYTQADQVTAITISAATSGCDLAISYTQDNQVTAATVSASNALSVSYSQADQTTTATVTGTLTSAINYAQDDQVTSITVNGFSGADLAISYTQDDQTTSVSIQADDFGLLMGGIFDKRKKRKVYEDIQPILEAIAETQPEAPVQVLKEELFKRDIEYKAAYKIALKAIIKAKAQAEQDDEDAFLMLM